MRWILGLIGAVLGSVVGEEVGLVVGLGAGFLIGWLVEREQQRAKFLAQRPAPQARPQSFEERASLRIQELTQRVELLERTVAELRAGAAPALPPSVPSEVAGNEASVAAHVRHAAPGMGATSDLSTNQAPLEPLHVATGEHELGAQASSEQLRVQAVEAARAAQAASGNPVQLDEFGWPRDAVSNAAGPVQGEPPTAAHGPLTPLSPEPPSPALEALRSFFLGGNTLVRIGVLVLTVGVGLLVKYAADDGYFPLELRLALAALIGLGLVVVGYRQRSARPAFGTALQGGGVAAMYLVTFFAYYAYQLLPGSLTMVVLIAIAALSSILAVVQDAQQLAVFGAIGGFLSPVLASSGGGSHIALFSYYALLNAAISGMAVFRSWRFLNWVGFAFTFGVASAWGALQYTPANMVSASGFLALFFLFYVFNGTLFALRQPDERRGTIDTTLTFGTPLATLALAGGMFRLEHLYLALSCVLIAAVYIVTARWLIARRDDRLKTLAAAYIAVGIGVATLAIPFALDNALGTALAWAAEASGLMWVGIRQQRLRTRVASYVLFAASLCAVLAREGEASAGGRALFFALIALSLSLSAYWVERHASALRKSEATLGHLLFALSFVLSCASIDALAATVPEQHRGACWLTASAALAALFELVGRRTNFVSARRMAGFVLFALSMVGTERSVPDLFLHPESGLGYPAVAAALSVQYWILWRQRTPLPTNHAELQHVLSAGFLALFVSSEANYWVEGVFKLAAGWRIAAGLVPLLSIVVLALGAVPAWPIAANLRTYRLSYGLFATMAASLVLLGCQLISDGSSAPLPYVPLLNPLDLVQTFVLVLLVLLARTPEYDRPLFRRGVWWVVPFCAFVAINGTIVRTANHWAGKPYRSLHLSITEPSVQSAFSIVWTIIALLAMLVANRKRIRALWVGGAVLLAVVVIKLFFLDLSQLSNVAKIVTFLAVGLLLLLIGFVAPVPPAERAREEPE